MSQFNEDAELALRCAIKFNVATKEAKGKKWTYIRSELIDLHDAMQLAKAVNGWYEVGIFAITDTGSGVFYWSSRFPEVLNSTVISPSIGVSSWSARKQ